MFFVLSFNAFAAVIAPSSGVVIIGDTGKNNEGQRKVADAIERYCQQEFCDLGMLAGDVVYDTGVSSEDDPILETVFDSYYNKLGIPFLITLGNHDYGWLSNDWDRGRHQLRHFFKNPLFYLPSYYYTYETQDAVVAVLDTTRLYWHKEINFMESQLKIAKLRAKLQKKWFIVMGHHPYLSNGKHGNAGRYEGIPGLGLALKKLFDKHVCGVADFYIAGHEHLLQAFDGNVAGCDTQLIVSGSAASAGKIKRDTPALFMSEERGYFHMMISPDEITVRALNENNKRLYEASYTK